MASLTFNAPLSAADPADQPAAKIEAPGHEDGLLQSQAATIRRLLQLSLDKSAIRLDRQHWDKQFEGKNGKEQMEKVVAELMKKGLPKEIAEKQAERMSGTPIVERLFQQLQQNVGLTSASSSSGNGYRQISFSGRGLAGRLMLKGRMVEIELMEEAGPGRTVALSDDGDGSVRLTVLKSDGAMMLNIMQARGGRFSLSHIRGDRVLADSSPSFIDFYREHKAYVNDELFPLLQHVGVGTPLTPYTPSVIKAVLSHLRPMPSAEKERCLVLLEQLDAEEFEERELATKELSKDFQRYRHLIADCLADETASAEVKSRLKRMLEEHADEDQIEQFILGLELVRDVPYLIELMEDSQAPAERETLLAALRTLTQQDFGNDVAAWKTWQASQGK